MSCKCEQKVKRPKYRIFGKWLVRFWQGKETIPTSLDEAVVDILNPCTSSPVPILGILYRYSPDGTRWRLDVSDEGATVWTEVDENCEEVEIQ